MLGLPTSTLLMLPKLLINYFWPTKVECPEIKEMRSRSINIVTIMIFKSLTVLTFELCQSFILSNYEKLESEFLNFFLWKKKAWLGLVHCASSKQREIFYHGLWLSLLHSHLHNGVWPWVGHEIGLRFFFLDSVKLQSWKYRHVQWGSYNS